MPAPDYARGAWISKKGSRAKHIGVIDRRQHVEPWRPLCNANDLTDAVVPVGTISKTFRDDPNIWFVDRNPTAWSGRNVCKNCIRVVEELNQMLHGSDPNTAVPAHGQGYFGEQEES